VITNFFGLGSSTDSTRRRINARYISHYSVVGCTRLPESHTLCMLIGHPHLPPSYSPNYLEHYDSEH
ncbi:hypothetical protein, partial [Providencia sp.]|uniref:hypothetical protein n=1 Tax=Providencia sp. TaxID=589 RepID=UPI003F980168